MNTITYVTTEWFIDTDITVIGELAKEYRIYWLYVYNPDHPRYNIKKLSDFANDAGIILCLYEHKGKYLSLSSLVLQYRLIRDIRKLAPDVVFRISTHLFWYLMSYELRKFKVVYGIHDAVPHSDLKGMVLIKWVLNHTILSNKYFILYSQYQYDLFREKWPQKNAVNVKMSVKSFGTSSLQPGSTEIIKLLFFGRIESYKGLDILINTIESLYKKGVNNLHLSICGKGPFWDSCKDLIITEKCYDLNVRFINTDEIPDMFSSHHFLVLPYRDATQSGPLMIAANYGLPIIAPDVKSFKEVYNDGCGVFYKQGQIEEALLIVSKMDDSDYGIMKEEAKTIRKKFSSDEIAMNYKNYFNSILYK